MNKKKGNKEEESNKITNFFKIKKCNLKNVETIEFCEEYKIQANHDKGCEAYNLETSLKKNNEEINTNLLLSNDKTIKNITKPHYENENSNKLCLLSNYTNKTKPLSSIQSYNTNSIHTIYNTQENDKQNDEQNEEKNDEKNTQIKSILFKGIKRTNSNGFVLNKKQKFESVKENNDQESILLKGQKLNQIISENKKNNNPIKRGRKRKKLLHEQNCLKEKESEEKKTNYFENTEKMTKIRDDINNMNRQGKKDDINKINEIKKNKENKKSVITLFGDDIKIKVNVDENVSSGTNSDLENSFTIFKSQKNCKDNSKCIETVLNSSTNKCDILYEWERERKCSYKRNSISDGENYNYKNYFVNTSEENIKEKKKCEIEDQDINMSSKININFSKNNLFYDIENNNEYNTYVSIYNNNNKTDYSDIFKFDAELESKKKYKTIQKGIHNDEHRKRHGNSRVSCIINSDSKNKKNIINLNHRKSCWNMDLRTNLIIEKTTPKKKFEKNENFNISENEEIQNNISWTYNNAFCKSSSIILNKTAIGP